VQFVSINPYTSEISIAWNKSVSPNILFTRVHFVSQTSPTFKGKTIIDIYENEDDTLIFKTDTLSIFNTQSDNTSLPFAVDAHNNNGETSTTLSELHSTMIVSNSYTICDTFALLEWNKYEGYKTSVTEYDVIEVSQTDTEQIIQTLPSGINSYKVNLNGLNNRRFYIKAHLLNFSGKEYISTSNMTTLNLPEHVSPTFLQAKNFEIKPNKQVAISWDLDTISEYTDYNIELSDNGIDFYTIQTESVTAGSDVLQTLIPAEKLASNTRFYRATALDLCEHAILHSDTIKAIQIQLTEINELTHKLNWDSCTMWNDLNYDYSIYRIVNTNQESIVGTLSANELTFNDDISDLQSVDPIICYKVVASYENGNYSYSNTSCIEKESKLHMPNAFNPSSSIAENRTFKPKYAFVAGDYSLQIFSRTASKIFESNNINIGWDGTVKGKMAPEGSYLYTLIVTMPSGKKIEKKGNVNLILVK